MSDNADIAELSDSFKTFLTAQWPREKAVAHARAPQSFLAELWSQITQLGWPALTVPEEFGGLGLDTQAAAALHEAIGAAVAPVPLLGTTLATALVATTGSSAQKTSLLPKLADGSLRVAIASPHGPRPSLAAGKLQGRADQLLGASAANLLLLPVRQGDADGWIALADNAPRLTIEHYALADSTHSLATAHLDDVAIDEQTLFLPRAGVSSLDEILLRHASIAIAADALGGGAAVLALTIDYMKVRTQFGRVIASFQALKHRVADHQAALVAARELVEHAASFEVASPDALLAALSAKQHVTRIVADIARDCIQLHGGVGFTAEFAPHIYLKRAKLNEALFGGNAALLDRIADLLEAA